MGYDEAAIPPVSNRSGQSFLAQYEWSRAPSLEEGCLGGVFGPIGATWENLLALSETFQCLKELFLRTSPKVLGVTSDVIGFIFTILMDCSVSGANAVQPSTNERMVDGAAAPVFLRLAAPGEYIPFSSTGTKAGLGLELEFPGSDETVTQLEVGDESGHSHGMASHDVSEPNDDDSGPGRVAISERASSGGGGCCGGGTHSHDHGHDHSHDQISMSSAAVSEEDAQWKILLAKQQQLLNELRRSQYGHRNRYLSPYPL